jgi:hypothetical protein
MYTCPDGTIIWIGHMYRDITKKEADAVIQRHNFGPECAELPRQMPE